MENRRRQRKRSYSVAINPQILESGLAAPLGLGGSNSNVANTLLPKPPSTTSTTESISQQHQYPALTLRKGIKVLQKNEVLPVKKRRANTTYQTSTVSARKSRTPTTSPRGSSGSKEKALWIRKTVQGGNNLFGKIFGKKRKMEAGLELNSVDDYGIKDVILEPGINDLHYYCYTGRLLKVRSLLSSGADVNVQNMEYNTPLHIAAAYNQILCVRELLKNREINTNVKNANGCTPLFLASQKGHMLVVKLLMEKGEADPLIKNKRGKTAWELSASRDVIDMYQESEAQCKAFFEYIKEGDLDGIKSVVDTIDINVKNEDGDNAIELCVKRKEMREIIELLCHHRIEFEKDVIKKALPEYCEYLRDLYLKRRREQVIVEIYQTEKSYLEDLKLILGLFGEEALSECDLGKKKKKSSAGILVGIKKIKHVRVIVEFFRSVSDVAGQSRELMENLKRSIPLVGYSEQDFVIESLMNLDYGTYKRAVHYQTELEHFVKTKKCFDSFWEYIQVQEKKIPYPKIQQFFSLASKPRFRLIKYKDLVSRILKYSSQNSGGAKLTKLLKECVGKIKETLRSIDSEVGFFENQKQMKEIKKLLKEKYKMDNFFLQNSSLVNLRKYLIHSSEIDCFDLARMEMLKMDFFVFSDTLMIGHPKKHITNYYYFDCKIFFLFSNDSIRVKIYKFPECTLLEDYFLKMNGKTLKWGKVLRDCFLLPGNEKFYFYSTRIIILDISEWDDHCDTVLQFQSIQKNTLNDSASYLIMNIENENKLNQKKIENNNILKQTIEKDIIQNTKEYNSVKFEIPKIKIPGVIKKVDLESPVIFKLKNKLFVTPTYKVKGSAVESTQRKRINSLPEFKKGDLPLKIKSIQSLEKVEHTGSDSSSSEESTTSSNSKSSVPSLNSTGSPPKIDSQKKNSQKAKKKKPAKRRKKTQSDIFSRLSNEKMKKIK